MSTLKPTKNSMKRMLAATFCLWLLAGAFSTALAAEPSDDLARGFAVPPDSARPHTWWHWMNGNITKEGITADLEAMKRVGIGGAQIFNVSEHIPDGPVLILSPQWLDLIHHAGQTVAVHFLHDPDSGRIQAALAAETQHINSGAGANRG